MIECLNKLRNRLISEKRYTDAVDEVLIKAANAKIKKIQNCRTESLIMKKYITVERTGLKYELVGDYYLIAGDDEPEKEQKLIGIWGQRHHEYLRHNKQITLSSLQISGKLNDYLADIDRQAEGMFERLVKQMAKSEGVTEQLKAADQMAWVGKMNNIRNRVAEIVNSEIIFR